MSFSSFSGLHLISPAVGISAPSIILNAGVLTLIDVEGRPASLTSMLNLPLLDVSFASYVDCPFRGDLLIVPLIADILPTLANPGPDLPVLFVTL
jgi:hypothetical protein